MEISEILLIVVLGLVICGTVICFFYSFWKIYQKAGYEGWEFLIPIYGQLILLRIIGKPWWWIFLLNIPIFNLIWHVWSNNLLSKRFGKDVGFTLGLVFLPIVFYPILAFSDAKYIPVGQEAPAEEPLTW
jgi:hypothetical protein